MHHDGDPTARLRERRFQGLVRELLPEVRRLNPTMPDDQVLKMAESMAELRLLDEEGTGERRRERAGVEAIAPHHRGAMEERIAHAALRDIQVDRFAMQMDIERTVHRAHP